MWFKNNKMLGKQEKGRKRWRKVIATMGLVTGLSIPIISQALNLPSGATQVGTLHNAPVVKSPTSDTSSQTFKDIISALLEGQETPKYVVNQVHWNNQSSLFNGKNLSTYGQSPTYVFGQDGFDPTDKAIELNVGDVAYIQNVGTAIDTDTGAKIPLSLGITYQGATAPGGGALGKVLMGAKSQNSVITLAWGATTNVGTGGGGGSTEGGGVSGGTNDGTGFWFIESIRYTIRLMNSDTGENLPNDTLMPIKMSDIDASQLATMDDKGARGYILSPDTALTPEGDGFKSSSDGAIIEDTVELSSNSYIVLKNYNSNNVQYKYRDGKNDHLDIVTGQFGSTPWDLYDLIGGYLEIDKSTVQFGKEPWNDHYDFSKLFFEVVSKDNKVVDTIQLNKEGKGKSQMLPPGDYTLREKSTNWESTGQTVIADKTVKVTGGKTNAVTVKNVAVTGENTLQKVDKDTEKAQNGKADLTKAKYQLFYNANVTGKFAHKKDEPVKWTDTPAPKLLKGEKVSEAIIGGQKVNFGDNVVIDVDDTDLQAGIGNLPIGSYYWLEVDSGAGYVTDTTKHVFTIKRQDDKTEVVTTDTVTSQEQIIKARITLDKKVTLPNNQGGSGYNGIEFTASPLESTVAEPVTFKTGVNPTTGDDGFASAELVYGDWILEETKGVEGYEDIKPIYIHMETDEEKDVLTISASYNKDFSQPFSKRSFTLKDSASEDNPNNEGTVGQVTPSLPTISLSTLHFNDNPNTPPEEPSVLPIKDVVKTEDGESINEGNVALNSDFFYVLKSSVKTANREDITRWSILDDFDENFDRYNGKFNAYATTDFGEYKAGDKLPEDFFTSKEVEKGKVLFTAEKAFLDVVNANKDKEVGFKINASFYRYKSSDKVVNVFDETINYQTEKSNEVFTKTPTVEPHKFDLSKEKVDLTGESLLDDDAEMDDRYKDSNDDPYKDKTDNNEKENMNTKTVKAGEKLVYQLWLDARPFDLTSKLTYLRMVDDYDEALVELDVKNVKVYDKEGKDVTEFFDIVDKDGVLTTSANVFKEATNTKGDKVNIIDTDKIALGQYYKIDVPMTVKKDVKPGVDIINTAKQEWADADGDKGEHITEKRVNKVEGKEETPTTVKDVAKKVADTVLPQTGDSPATRAVKLLGFALVGTAVYFKFFRKNKEDEAYDNQE